MIIQSLKQPTWASNKAVQEYALLIAGASGGISALQWLQSLDSAEHLRFHKPGSKRHEVRFNAAGPAAFELFTEAKEHATGFDLFVLPQRQRQIKLLICDMDSTIIPTESLDELASYVGMEKEVTEITAQAMRGELDFTAALNQRVGMLKGLSASVINECVKKTKFNAGARRLITAANSAGIRTVLVSGGFSPFVKHVAETLGFSRWLGNELEIVGNELTGKVLAPIVDKHSKLKLVQEECASLGLPSSAACSLGDGANDIPMLQGTGLGIAYRAKPQVLEATPYHLQHADFTAVIKLLDYQRH